MNERIFLAFLLLSGAVYMFFGLRIEVPFSYDPLGPRAFPVLLGAGLVILCIVSWAGAEISVVATDRRVAKFALAVIFYLLAFQLLGFMPATTITVYVIARGMGSSWMQGLLAGLLIAISFYGIFHFFLKVPLPLGQIFRVVG